jgi:hypothetical protein
MVAVYNNFTKEINGGVIWNDNSSTTIKAMLVDDTYNMDITGHTVISDVTGEISGTGYTAGGALVVNRTTNLDNPGDETLYKADNIDWDNSTITAYGVVIYKDTGTPSTSLLISYADFGENKSTNDGTFSLVWNVDGVFVVYNDY